MRGIEAALEHLQVVRLDNVLADAPLVIGYAGPLELRQFVSGQIRRTHEDPDNATPLARGIRDCLHLVFEVTFGGLIGHIHTCAVVENFQP